VFKAHRLLYHSTLGLRVIKKNVATRARARASEKVDFGGAGRDRCQLMQDMGTFCQLYKLLACLSTFVVFGIVPPPLWVLGAKGT